MVELTWHECKEINGGASWGIVLSGAGVAVIGVACMVAAPTIAVTVGGYALYNAGAIGMVLGACEI